MRVIKPVNLTDVMVSTDATETVALYSAATTYAAGATARFGNSIYTSVQAGNTGHNPETEPLWWVRTGPSNAWAMFDGAVNTQTTRTGSLSLTLQPGMVNSLALFNMAGQTLQVTVLSAPSGGELVYDRTINLDGTVITDWYQYFFEPYVQLGDVVLTDLPPYSGMLVNVSIVAGNPTDTAAIAQVSVGTAYTLGDGQYGATASITDYSRKDTDEFGTATLLQRAYSKRMSIKLAMPTGAINKVQRVLADLRSTPCAWVGVEDDPYNTFAPLSMWGFYKDFSIEVAYASESYCSLEVEGLT